MKWNLCILLLGMLLGCKTAPASHPVSNDFEVGSSSVSIEPDNSLFSLTLAGYGYPGEGRFTLEWIARGEAPALAWMTGDGNRLYGIDREGQILVLDDPQKQLQWQPLESSAPVRYMAALQGKLYALDLENNWVSASPSDRRLNWKRVTSPIDHVVALTSSEECLYAATSENELFEGRPSGSRIRWEKIGSAESVIGMAGYKARIFALTSNQILWRRDAEERNILWTKIGYNNGCTYDIDLQQIAVASDRLFAIGDDGRLYIAQHRTYNNLTARALAVRKGAKTVVVVGVDLTGLDYAFVNEVKAEIFRREGIPYHAVMINSSHTHFAPVSQNYFAWPEQNQRPDPLYMEQVLKPNIVRAVSEAVGNLKPARLFFGTGSTRIGGNRCLSGDDALYDPTVDVLKVEDANHALTDVLFLTGCHPVFRNAGMEGFSINGNFPSVAKQLVQERSGAANALFLQGCAGDINPLYDDFNTMGSLLAEDVLTILDAPMSPIDGEISFAMDSLLIPVKAWSPAQITQFRTENSGHPGDLEAEKNVRWANIMLDHYEQGTMPGYMPIYVQTINIGNWKLIGLSREVVTQYGIELRKLWPDQPVSVVGYTNDVGSYLPAAPHVRAQTYEGYNSFFWYAQPGIFPENILDTVVSFIREQNR